MEHCVAASQSLSECSLRVFNSIRQVERILFWRCVNYELLNFRSVYENGLLKVGYVLFPKWQRFRPQASHEDFVSGFRAHLRFKCPPFCLLKVSAGANKPMTPVDNVISFKVWSASWPAPAIVCLDTKAFAFIGVAKLGEANNPASSTGQRSNQCLVDQAGDDVLFLN
ncbi:MAG: hypothetical protein ACD_23C00984G0009 [uncultured bacterium]|nr:MAG: hypothetical protein ACD_23C00984G0009 [uncultured bacterium]